MCILICSDHAKAITGKNNGLVIKPNELMPHMEWTYCFLHKHALVAKNKMSKMFLSFENNLL